MKTSVYVRNIFGIENVNLVTSKIRRIVDIMPFPSVDYTKSSIIVT